MAVTAFAVACSYAGRSQLIHLKHSHIKFLSGRQPWVSDPHSRTRCRAPGRLTVVGQWFDHHHAQSQCRTLGPTPTKCSAGNASTAPAKLKHISVNNCGSSSGNRRHSEMCRWTETEHMCRFHVRTRQQDAGHGAPVHEILQNPSFLKIMINHYQKASGC